MTAGKHLVQQKVAWQTGELGEDVACRWLRSRGYDILCRNYRTRRGELDIVARKGNVIAFVEVKTRNGGRLGEGVYAVGTAKQFHLRKAAETWLAANRWADQLWPRFDVLEVRLLDRCAHILYIPGAF